MVQNDHDNNTPLVVAVNKNYYGNVDKIGLSSKDVAFYLGYYDIASLLTNLIQSQIHLEEKFYTNVPNTQNQLFKMCQTCKGTKNQLDSFIRAVANVNGVDINCRTPLVVATENCSKQFVK